MLLLPLLNPVDAAENVATLDHITHGRLDVGVAIGYREKEPEAAGRAHAEGPRAQARGVARRDEAADEPRVVQ
jgi:alkanesulfonate monooxygenase SsuD/methylene tetrahydromethanopterin reductase-like flavin-dependent oxidoreductase (luciferase family)